MGPAQLVTTSAVQRRPPGPARPVLSSLAWPVDGAFNEAAGADVRVLVEAHSVAVPGTLGAFGWVGDSAAQLSVALGHTHTPPALRLDHTFTSAQPACAYFHKELTE